MKYIDRLSWPLIIIMSIFLAFAPFGTTPHIVEKANMLVAGTLVKPLDIFDLFMHSAPIVILGIKIYRQFILKINQAI